MRKAIILAAGKGTRMLSDTFKVLHTIGNRSMIGHLLDALKKVSADVVVVVLSPKMDAVQKEIAPTPFFIQKQALATLQTTGVLIFQARDATT